MGNHIKPRRKLSATDEEFKAWDIAARRCKMTWASWVRAVLNDLVHKPKKAEQTER